MIKKFFLMMFLVTPVIIFSQDKNIIEAQTKISFENKNITITIKNPLNRDINSLQDAKFNAQKEIDSIFSQIVQAAVEPIILNSKETVKDSFINDISLISKIDGFESDSFILTSFLSKDLKLLNAEFTIPLYENFSPIFISHDFPVEITPVLGFIATYEWTGIIIVATDELQVYGTDEVATLQPALFPKLLDDTGKTFLTHNNISPEVIAKWGYLTYVDNENSAPYERIGDYPLRIIANGVFGKNMTDIVIPKNDADKILVSKKNIDLLKNGKIVVVCRKDNLNFSKTIKLNK